MRVQLQMPRCDECAKSPVGSAENSCTSGVRSAYESFISRHDLTAKYFVQQVRLASAALLDHDEKPDIAVQTTEELVASAAIVAGFSRLLAEKLLLLDGKDLSNGGSHRIARRIPNLSMPENELT